MEIRITPKREKIKKVELFWGVGVPNLCEKNIEKRLPTNCHINGNDFSS